MCFVNSIRQGVIQHGVQRRRDGLESDHAGKNGAISNVRINHERRPLIDL